MPKLTRIASFRRLKEWLFAGPAGAVFRGMATLALGNIAAKVIGLAILPILSRLYSPTDFGVLAAFVALISTLTPVVTLRYVVALPLPLRDGMAMNLMVLVVALMLSLSVMAGVGFSAVAPDLPGAFDADLHGLYGWLLAIGLICVSGYEVLSFWATRKRAYADLAKAMLVHSLLGNLVKVALGALSIKPMGLLIGHISSNCGGIASLVVRLKLDFVANRRAVSLRRIVFLAKHYRNFPIYRLPSQFLLTFAAQAPLLFFFGMFGADATGQLSMALAVVAMPLAMFGQSVSKAYYAEAARIGTRDPVELMAVTQAVTKKLLVISLSPFLVLALGGDVVFSVVFGSQWSSAGLFASTLSAYLVAQFVTSPVMNVFNILNKQGVFLIINLIRVASVISVFLVAVPTLSLSAFEAVFAYSVVMTVFYWAVHVFVVFQIRRLK